MLLGSGVPHSHSRVAQQTPASHFRKHIVSIIKRLKNADLPGGVKINLQETIQEAEKLSDEVRNLKPPGPGRDRNGPGADAVCARQ